MTSLIPKLCDAIEIGSALTDERRDVFYEEREGDLGSPPERPCACAVGSAAAAVGEGHLAGVAWLKERWPWTDRPIWGTPLLEAFRVATGLSSSYGQPGLSIAEAISVAHYEYVPRLEIARLIRPYEEALEAERPEAAEVTAR